MFKDAMTPTTVTPSADFRDSANVDNQEPKPQIPEMSDSLKALIDEEIERVFGA